VSAKRRILVDILAATLGVAASWIVADLVVAIDERRKPLLLDLKKFPHHFANNERMAGVFHIGQSEYDTMHAAYHTSKVRKGPVYHGAQALVSLFRFGYHIAWAYARHYQASPPKG